MKIVTVVGARPQFIKAAAVSKKLRREHTEILVHTGQHYDLNMSEIFFEELQLPKPDLNLNVGSGTHAKQTADMMVGIENVLLKEKPDYIMVYGDTNSTLAGAIAASKLHVPVVHVEAGLRSHNMEMPEEINRILTDRISKLLLCPTESAVEHLRKEGIYSGVYNIGDVMCDAVQFYSEEMEKKARNIWFSRLHYLVNYECMLDKWYLATIHRAENTDSTEKVEEILKALERLDSPVIFPIHPRTRKLVIELVMQHKLRNIIIVEPVGYLDMLFFAKYAVKVITDSGGLQKETYILGTPCITVREQTEWSETLVGNHNILAHPVQNDIYEKVMNTQIDNSNHPNYYGSGCAAEYLCQVIKEANN